MPPARTRDDLSPRAWLQLSRSPDDREWRRAGSAGARAALDRAASFGNGRPEVTAGADDDATGRHRRPEAPGPRLLTMPSALRTSRWSPSMPAVLGVLAVVVVVLVVLGVRVVLASRDTGIAVEPVARPSVALSRGGSSLNAELPAASTSSGAAGVRPGDDAASDHLERDAAGGPGVPAGEVVVDVVGQVRAPGVVSLPGGSRVRDAIAAAGGVAPPADLAAINSARLLVDGEQVRVPRPGEPVPMAGGSPSGRGTAGGAAQGRVNLNTADLDTLDTLPGVGPVLAQRIVDWRAEHQRFSSVDELGEVSGIGEKLLAQLRPKVTV